MFSLYLILALLCLFIILFIIFNKEKISIYCPCCADYTVHDKIDNITCECEECGRRVNF